MDFARSYYPEYIRREGPGYFKLWTWVQPGARKNEVAGCFQGWLKVRIQARPVGNQANKELLAFLARKLNLKKNQLVLESGQTSRKKVLSLSIIEEPDWQALEF